MSLDWWEGLLLGLVQGLTEFLPISSSGHLVLAERALGYQPDGVFLEVMVHVATLLSVVIAYRRRIGTLLRGLLSGGRDAWRYAGLLLVASVPAGLAGILLRDFFERTFHSLSVLGWSFLLTAGLLWSTRWAVRRTAGRQREDGTAARRHDGRPAADSATQRDPVPAGRPAALPSSRPAVVPSVSQALIMGAAQAVSILPAISRSGATIAAGLWTGLPAAVAAEFSFLMSIIVIAGSGLLEARHLMSGAQAITPGLTAAFGAALLSGVASIYLLVALLRRGKFHYFAPYCAGLGILCLVWFAF